MLAWIGGTLLGWSLGANDAANVFGTAVSARIVAWRHAAVLCSIFLITGAILQGSEGIETLRSIAGSDTANAGLAALTAALTVTFMTLLRLPVSTSQAVVGALAGFGIAHGNVDLSGLGKVIICWIGTPLGAMVLSYLLYVAVKWLLHLGRPSLFAMDHILRWGLVVCGCYGAYALGANNVANVASFFVGPGQLSPRLASAAGGLCIALGVLTLSRGVMLTVGKGITPLDGYSALIVVLAQAITVHIYALIGVPVSTSQAIIGAVLGIGLRKGVQIINVPLLIRVFAGWLSTPVLAGFLAWLLAFFLR